MNENTADGGLGDLKDKEAGSLITTAVPTARVTDIAGGVMGYIQNTISSYDTIDYVYVLDENKLVGVFSIHELFSANPSTTVRDFMVTNVASVHTHTDREHVAQLALAQSIKAVPVLNSNGEFAGVVPADAILNIFNVEHREYLYQSTGIKLDASDTYQNLSWTHKVSSRSPWLVLGLIGGVCAALIVGLFEETIAVEIALAAFIPAIVYVGDAVGNQSEMLFVRWLSKPQRTSAWKYFCTELLVGTFIGILLAVLMFIASFIWLQNITVSTILGLTIMATVYLSIIITIALPWLSQKLGFDPAVASGPLATVACDISSLLVYLLIASALL